MGTVTRSRRPVLRPRPDSHTVTTTLTIFFAVLDGVNELAQTAEAIRTGGSGVLLNAALGVVFLVVGALVYRGDLSGLLAGLAFWGYTTFSLWHHPDPAVTQIGIVLSLGFAAGLLWNRALFLSDSSSGSDAG